MTEQHEELSNADLVADAPAAAVERLDFYDEEILELRDQVERLDNALEKERANNNSLKQRMNEQRNIWRTWCKRWSREHYYDTHKLAHQLVLIEAERDELEETLYEAQEEIESLAAYTKKCSGFYAAPSPPNNEERRN